MPLYEYKCANDHLIQVTRSIFDPETQQDCEECGFPMRKKFSSSVGISIDDGNMYTKMRKKEFGI